MKRIALLLCAAIVFCTCTACGSNEKAVTVAYDLSASPANIDPQSAVTQDAIILLNHIMQGLYRIDEQGEAQKALAADTTVSQDGTTYTITIRDDAMWFYLDEDKNEQSMPVTAQDFVFAFRRLLRPDTQSPGASRFFCIQNAEEVNNGTLSEEELGVWAQDERTVVFQLTSANDSFLYLLASTYAMPCNEAFFEEARGRYGLNEDTILSNGAYRISSWDTSSQIRLVKNSSYYDAGNVLADQIRFRITTSETDRTDITRLSDGTVDAMLLSGEAASALSEKDYRVTWIESGTWGLLINTQDEVLSNTNIRRGIAQCFDRSVYEPMLPSYLEVADTLFPDSASIFGALTASSQSATGIAADVQAGIASYESGLLEVGQTTLDGVALLVNGDAGQDVTTYFLQVSQLLQRDLGIYISIETVDASEYQSRMASGDYDIAAVCFEAADNDVLSYLEPFITGSSENLCGYSNSRVDDLFYSASVAQTAASALADCRSAEAQILNSGVFLPMFRQLDAFVVRQDTSGLVYNSNTGMVSLSGTQFS